MHVEPIPVFRACLAALPDPTVKRLLTDADSTEVLKVLRVLSVKVQPRYMSASASRHLRTLIGRLDDDASLDTARILINPMITSAQDAIGEAIADPNKDEFFTAVGAVAQKYGWQAGLLPAGSWPIIWSRLLFHFCFAYAKKYLI